MDLVNVSQALHWFDLDAFYDEVRRVAVNGGTLAVSSYDSATLDITEFSRVLSNSSTRRLAITGRRGAAVGLALSRQEFPFPEIELPNSSSRPSGHSTSW